MSAAREQTQQTPELKEMLEWFSEPQTLHSVQDLAKRAPFWVFARVEEWATEQIKQRERELEQIPAGIRRQLFSDDRAGSERLVLRRAVIEAEIVELKRIRLEIAYCKDPGRARNELSQLQYKRWVEEQRARPVIASG